MGWQRRVEGHRSGFSPGTTAPSTKATFLDASGTASYGSNSVIQERLIYSAQTPQDHIGQLMPDHACQSMSGRRPEGMSGYQAGSLRSICQLIDTTSHSVNRDSRTGGLINFPVLRTSRDRPRFTLGLYKFFTKSLNVYPIRVPYIPASI